MGYYDLVRDHHLICLIVEHLWRNYFSLLRQGLFPAVIVYCPMGLKWAVMETFKRLRRSWLHKTSSELNELSGPDGFV